MTQGLDAKSIAFFPEKKKWPAPFPFDSEVYASLKLKIFDFCFAARKMNEVIYKIYMYVDF